MREAIKIQDVDQETLALPSFAVTMRGRRYGVRARRRGPARYLYVEKRANWQLATAYVGKQGSVSRKDLRCAILSLSAKMGLL